MEMNSSKLFKVGTQIQGINEAYYVSYHHAMRAGYQDRISKSLNDFKEGIEPQASKWVSLAAPIICTAQPFDVVVRALRSVETSASAGLGLDRLCEAIASKSGSVYAPERLSKSRATRTLPGLGGRVARQKELADAFTFDGTGLDATARILVVDDILTTGSTLEAIAVAVRKSLPEAAIIGFVLGKSDAMAPNTHLNAEYFAESLHGHGVDPTATILAKPSVGRPAPMKVTSLRLTGKLTSAPKRSSVKMYVIGIVLAFIVLGALVPLRSGKTTGIAEAGNIEPFQISGSGDHAVPSLGPAQVPAALAEAPRLRMGMVTVPNVGLRVKHSLESKTVANVAVTSGEKVEIIKKFSPNDGPSWIQVRTRLGRLGWVFASVVREQKQRM